MDLIIITFILIGVVGVLDQYLKEKRSRESKMKDIARRLEAIERKEKSEKYQEREDV
ncbi:hypothetical protein [Arenicella xantha]|uniref:Uncharacterized protein n=1 Tax=Arenicella xantha TaxID=644221 RepID=A0A395JGT1_9GAMM|nr:hypothetical protein [Arenicella xantha]RBP46998.1 hypothetical protein DFR28_1151 [Arenicella xantha]